MLKRASRNDDTPNHFDHALAVKAGQDKGLAKSLYKTTVTVDCLGEEFRINLDDLLSLGGSNFADYFLSENIEFARNAPLALSIVVKESISFPVIRWVEEI